MTAPIAKHPPDAYFQLVTNIWTKPFWDAAAQQRLVAPRCAACGLFRMPPTPFCPRCQSQQLDWVTLSGRGVVYSYSTVERAILPEMADCLPYITAIITLEGAEGVRLISNIVDVPIDSVRVGDPVEAVWNHRPGAVPFPRFVLSRGMSRCAGPYVDGAASQ